MSRAAVDWLGQPALVLETEALRLITVPHMGAKIVSLFDKQQGREWLLPPIQRAFVPVPYGSSFVAQDMSGWDEIFPTTDACPYPLAGRYHQTPLPDHGEVWALAWQIDAVTPDRIQLSVQGLALPYRLTRTIQTVDSQHLRILFEVVNTGDEPLIALWSAHPQFAVDSETRIRLPAAVRQMVNGHVTDEWAEAERLYAWPDATSDQGTRQTLDAIGSADLHQCRKFFIAPDQPIGWAALQQGAAGAWVRLSWDVRAVPYFGLWVDEGTYNPAPTAALEPTTGYYDRLDRAWDNRRVMHLPPAVPLHWSLDVAVGTGAVPQTLDE